MEIKPYSNWPGGDYQIIPSEINFDFLWRRQSKEKNYSLNEIVEHLERIPHKIFSSFTFQSKINLPLENEKIIEIVCNVFGVKFNDLKTCQKYRIVEPKRMAIYVLSKFTYLEMADIGKIFNLKWCIVYHHIKKSEGFLSYEKSYIEKYNEIISELKELGMQPVIKK